MSYNRKDGKVRSRILAETDDELLIQASWPASGSDEKNFRVLPDGRAINTLVVSRKYFEEKYGAN